MKLNSIEPSVEVEAAEEPIKYILELISSSPSEEEVASQLSDTNSSAVKELLISDFVDDSESAVVSGGFVQNEEQSATLETIHEQVSKTVQSAENQAAVGNPLCKIAAEIDRLGDPDVDIQQFSAALMSFTSVLGNTTTTNSQVADTVG